MNGAPYAAQMDMDALDLFCLGGGGVSHQDNNRNLTQTYRGPQSDGYDPSAAAAPPRSLASYAHAIANTPGIHNHAQHQPQQSTLPAFHGAATADYLALPHDSLLTTILGGPAPYAPQQHARSQYQQHTVMSTGNSTNLSAFDPHPIQFNQAGSNANNSVHAQNTFDDFFALVAQHGGAPVSADNSFSTGLASPSTTALETPSPTIDQHDEPWLIEIKISVPSLSLEPMTGSEVMNRLQDRMNDVITKYLPCVDFLVQCQQDLRKGLIHAQQDQKRVGSSRRYFQNTGLTPREFWSTHVSQLPEKFMKKNRMVMEKCALSNAVHALEKLRDEAMNSTLSSCEAVKNSFLGGMKEGESWGLRKWLSRHGNALAVCTDLECILKGLKTLDKTAEYTKRLGNLLRPKAESTLKKLKSDVPLSYQERSSAHPYLPFFHRLESALRDASQFDPEDDGIICLDDSDDDDIVEVSPPPPRKRKAKTSPPRRRKISKKDTTQLEQEDSEETVVPPIEENSQPQEPQQTNDDGSSSGSELDSELVEVVGFNPLTEDENVASIKNWRCKNCSALCGANTSLCLTCGHAQLNDRSRSDNEGPPSVSDYAEIAAIVQESDFNDDNDILDHMHKDEDANTEETTPKPKKKRSPGKKKGKNGEPDRTSHLWPIPAHPEEMTRVAQDAMRMAGKLDNLASYFRDGREDDVRPTSVSPTGSDFWDDGDRYADALELFANLLRSPEVVHFMERVNGDLLLQANPEAKMYSHVIKNPLCFKDILSALFLNSNKECDNGVVYQDGRLNCVLLKDWNMWNGKQLLMALDLVLLNSLAYGKITGEGRSRHRARTNELRKILWNGIQAIISENSGSDDSNQKRQYTPTRRSENSGFVVYKISEGEEK